MPVSDNATVYYEAGLSLQDFVALADQGDQIEFRSADTMWSKQSGYAPDVKPNGLATGGTVSVAASGSDDVVDVAALTCYLAGVLTSVAASTDLSIPRPSVEDYQKLSITVNSSGALAVVEGAEHTEFSSTRGADGGPPWIPSDSIEIAQVWYSSGTSAAVTASEIKQVVGTHVEMYNFPTWDVQTFNVENGVLGYAGIEFHSALPAIHSDDDGSTTAGKEVYAKYYTPTFAEVPRVSDFVPPETSHSVSSKQIYGQVLAAAFQSLNQGSFTAYLEDGITDPLIAQKNKNLLWKFFQDRANDPYILCQGLLGISRTFPAGDQIQASCTVSAEEAGAEVNS